MKGELGHKLGEIALIRDRTVKLSLEDKSMSLKKMKGPMAPRMADEHFFLVWTKR